ncbi:MAG: CAP domain-containing protein [Alphaproteobacteria bacterium]|nr:CAP domain-containing protein [Alphaproteobacteria bacterium]
MAYVHPPPPDPRTQMAALETRIYQLVEAARLKTNPKARPLVLDAELMHVAREKSADMAAKRYMAHRSPDGQTSASLIMAEDANFQGLLGENIAAQYYTRQGGVDVETYARRFVDTWLASKSHRDNLSFADYDHTGIGAAVNGDTVYVTELFSSDLGLATSPQGQQGAGAARDKRILSAYPDPLTAKAAPPAETTVRLRGAMGETAADGR